MVDLQVFLLYHFQKISTLLCPLVWILLDFFSSRLILYRALYHLGFSLHGLFDVDFYWTFIIFIICYNLWLLFIFSSFFIAYHQLYNILLFLLQSQLQLEYLCLFFRDFLFPMRQQFPRGHEFIFQFFNLILLLIRQLLIKRQETEQGIRRCKLLLFDLCHFLSEMLDQLFDVLLFQTRSEVMGCGFD